VRVDPKAFESEIADVRALWKVVFGEGGPER